MKVRLKVWVPDSIYEEPKIKERLDNLFCELDPEIVSKICDILDFLRMKPCKELGYDNIYNQFKDKFFKKVLRDAITASFSGEGGYNVLSNILNQLTEENLRQAIMGKEMIDVFTKAIRSVPTNSAFDKAARGSKIYLLTQKYVYNDEPDDFDEDSE